MTEREPQTGAQEKGAGPGGKAETQGGPSGTRGGPPVRARILGIALLVAVVAVLGMNVLWVARNLGELRALGPGERAPAFELHTLEGDLVRSEDLKGRVLVLDFWSVTCPPCLKALPELSQVAKRFADAPVTVLGIHMQGGPRWRGAVSAEVANMRLGFPVLMDEGGHVSEAYKIRVMPTTVLVDKRGRIRKVWRGATDISRFEAEIRRALAD